MYKRLNFIANPNVFGINFLNFKEKIIQFEDENFSRFWYFSHNFPKIETEKTANR